MSHPPRSIESKLAEDTLVLMARHSMPRTYEFSGWLLTLTGASIALILSKVDVFTTYIAPLALKAGLLIMLASALFGLLAKYMNSISSTMLSVREESERIGMKASTEATNLGKELDWPEYEREVTRGLFWPASRAARTAMRRTLAGDYNFGAIRLAKFGQIQSFFIGLQFIFVVIGPAILVFGLTI